MVNNTVINENTYEQQDQISIFETIKQRRSIGKMTEQRPTRAQIERLLEAATHAPNHHKAEPWKFFVLAGKARQELGSLMRESLAAELGDATHHKHEAMLDKEAHKPLRSPVLIAVASEYQDPSQTVDIENVEATAAAVQNMLLAAEEIGLAAIWRTGNAAYDPRVKQWLGLSPADHIVAFLYVGFPAIPRQERYPRHFKTKTAWLGWTE